MGVNYRSYVFIDSISLNHNNEVQGYLNHWPLDCMVSGDSCESLRSSLCSVVCGESKPARCIAICVQYWLLKEVKIIYFL